MIDQLPPVRAADALELLAAGTSLAVTSAATNLLSDQIALAHAAPELLCFAEAEHVQSRAREAAQAVSASSS